MTAVAMRHHPRALQRVPAAALTRRRCSRAYHRRLSQLCRQAYREALRLQCRIDWPAAFQCGRRRTCPQGQGQGRPIQMQLPAACVLRLRTVALAMQAQAARLCLHRFQHGTDLGVVCSHNRCRLHVGRTRSSRTVRGAFQG